MVELLPERSGWIEKGGSAGMAPFVIRHAAVVVVSFEVGRNARLVSRAVRAIAISLFFLRAASLQQQQQQACRRRLTDSFD